MLTLKSHPQNTFDKFINIDILEYIAISKYSNRNYIL
jgi:hypothetical protein